MSTKQCTGCGRVYPATTEYFNRKGRSNDVLRPKCKQCELAYRQANKDHKRLVGITYRENNREELRRKKREYHLAHREEETQRYCDWVSRNREHVSAYQKEYWHSHRDSKREYDAQYREKNRAKIISRQKRWYHKNLETARVTRRAAAARRRAILISAEGAYTRQDVERLYSKQKGRCYYCGAKVGKKYHVDHVIPLSRGGSNSPDNLVIACPSCNCRKSSKLPHEWKGSSRLL